MFRINLRSMAVTMVRVLIIFGAIGGFLTQVSNVSYQYFRYQTRTQVYIRIPEKAVFHNLAVCIGFNDLLDADRLMKDAGIKLKQPQIFMEMIAEPVFVTVKQVFDYTPRGNEVLDWCLVRNGSWLLDTKYNTKGECYEHFNVTKYMTQEFICYKIQPAELPVIELRHVTQSQYFAFGVYGVELTKTVKDTHNLNTISFMGDYPYISRDFSAFSLVAGDNGNANVSVNVFDVFSADVEVQQLPSPFDTDCQPVASDKQFTCKYECLKERYKQEKRIHPNIIISEPLDYAIISQVDLKDERVAALVTKNDEECHRECFFNPCVMQYTKTSVSASFDPEITLAFTMRSATEPDILSISEPVMIFVEYFSFMCSCFGTWFGVCFLSLDPFRYKFGQKYREKILIRRAKVRVLSPAFYYNKNYLSPRYGIYPPRL